MATEQYHTNSFAHNEPLGDGSEEWKSSSVPTDINSSGGFDCNICLDTVQDPVVTICGHLYCWPCIYKWIHQQSISPEAHVDHQPQCPVCKAEISERTLIPLYVPGQSATGSEKKTSNLALVIPDRPRGPPYGIHTLIATSTTTSQHPTQEDAHHHHGYLPSPAQAAAYYLNFGDYSYTSAPAISLAGSTTFYPIISMFREMIYARLFGNSQSFSTYPVSYGMAATGSGRARRHILHADQSLSRLSFFLCYCLVLCLVLF